MKSGDPKTTPELCERNYATEVAALSDWLKNVAPVFQPMGSKTKTNYFLYVRFFPRSEQVR